ncbi:transcriptional regulator [Rhizobium cauense]|uniref:transcriptional repressor TraM n=1 Tax=Rhizobium cauense TaxID=1166683 RepID=UPI001C6EB58A|nr:transcriptional repressor TraM [Rhizobium cauense]MBW9116379.1 transcriptional regulator [Rhizobium cauense]
MVKTEETAVSDLNLQPIVGLLRGVPEPVIEHLTVTAIQRHRNLINKADTLFHRMPPHVKAGYEAAGVDHIEYLETAIEMHSQMLALTTLLDVLGRTPKA